MSYKHYVCTQKETPKINTGTSMIKIRDTAGFVWDYLYFNLCSIENGLKVDLQVDPGLHSLNYPHVYDRNCVDLDHK